MSSASAATAPAPATGSITTSIPCTVGGVASTCQLTVTSFKVVNGAIDAVGTVTGGGVTVPFQAPVQATDSCQILDLTLGPLHLGSARAGGRPQPGSPDDHCATRAGKPPREHPLRGRESAQQHGQYHDRAAADRQPAESDPGPAVTPSR